MNPADDSEVTRLFPLRFVVLHHDPGKGFSRTQQPHFDWLFEKPEGTLLSFATDCFERLDGEIASEAKSLADHRRDYLDYEGPVSNDRGVVRQVIRGSYRMITADAGRWEASLFWNDDAGGQQHYMRSLFAFDEMRGVWHFALSRDR